MVVEDLNNGYITKRYAEGVYGVIVRKENGKWKINEKATTRQREAIRQQRAESSIPVSEWWEKARERVLKQDFIRPIQNMYAQSMNLSDSWAKEYRHFWDLPEKFAYKED